MVTRHRNLSVNPYLICNAASGMSSKANFDPRSDLLYPEETIEREDKEGVTGDIMEKAERAAKIK